MCLFGEEPSRLTEELVQWPRGGNMPGLFEQQGGQWSGVQGARGRTVDEGSQRGDKQ